MKDCIAEKMLKRIVERLYWANQQQAYYQGVKDALEKINAVTVIFTSTRAKIVDKRLDEMDSIIWEMTSLLACYYEEDHQRVWDRNHMEWKSTEEHRKNYKLGYDNQMEKVK